MNRNKISLDSPNVYRGYYIVFNVFYSHISEKEVFNNTRNRQLYIYKLKCVNKNHLSKPRRLAVNFRIKYFNETYPHNINCLIPLVIGWQLNMDTPREKRKTAETIIDHFYKTGEWKKC